MIATSDPALQESADRGKVKLLDYTELYHLWERQQWATQDIDFTQDRVDWHERFPKEERFAAHVRAVGVLHRRAAGHRRAGADHARRADRGDADLPLDPDRRRGSPRAVLQPLLRGGRGARGRRPRRALRTGGEQPQRRRSASCSTDAHQRVDRLAAEPEDKVALVEAITLYHMVIEGMLALTGQHFIIGYNNEQGTLPGFVEGFGNVARDEHRHAAFGARFLTEMAAADDRYRDAIQRMMVEALPIAEEVLDPPWAEDDEDPRIVRRTRCAETQAPRRPVPDPAAEGDRPRRQAAVPTTDRLTIGPSSSPPIGQSQIQLTSDPIGGRQQRVRDYLVPPNPHAVGVEEASTWERWMSSPSRIRRNFGKGCSEGDARGRTYVFRRSGCRPHRQPGPVPSSPSPKSRRASD